MSVGPAFAHGNHNDCRWNDNRGWHDHDNRGDCDDRGGRNIGQFIADHTTSVWR
jgi:hypothetical protein